MVSASGPNILPSMPCSVISGRNTRMMMAMPKMVGVATSVVAESTVRTRAPMLSPAWPSLWNTFSTTTTVASTMRPMAIASPPSDMRLAEMPRSEEHTSELQSPCNLVCRLLLEKNRVLTVVDNWSRQSPVLEAGVRMSGEIVGQVLDRALNGTQGPRSLTVDHGTAFQSWALEDL